MIRKWLKSGVKAVLDRIWIPFAQYTAERVIPYSIGHLPKEPWLLGTSLYQMAWERARSTSLDYAEANMRQALIFPRREQLWDHAIRAARTQGLAAEFGVFEGYSITRFAPHFDLVFGFDSFRGLRDDWVGHELPKGSFDLKGVLPTVPANVRLVPGWFDETLPPFLKEHPDNFKFVHIDCDTYEATVTVLSLIGPRLRAGTILVFDEYFGFPGWREGEFRAWEEHVRRSGIRYQYISYSEEPVALRIL